MNLNEITYKTKLRLESELIHEIIILAVVSPSLGDYQEILNKIPKGTTQVNP